MPDTQAPQDTGQAPQKAFRNFWGRLLGVIIVLLAIAAIVFFAHKKHPSPAPAAATSKPFVIAPVIGPRTLMNSGFTGSLLMGNSVNQVTTDYVGTTTTGNLEAVASFTTPKPIVDVWQYYQNYFKNDGWSFTETTANFQTPTPSSSSFALSAWLKNQNAVVYALKGKTGITVKVSLFSYQNFTSK